MQSDPFEHFVTAQAEIYASVRSELAAGAKRSHWMWFIFPQLKGLGRSWTAQRYALPDPAAARAYLSHPLLGPRLIECTELALRHAGRPLERLFPPPDDLKFISSMTLFAGVAGPESIFGQALVRLAGGRRCAFTEERLAREADRSS
ncbi:MAG: DUF1810 domain-containing protein [Casimicrobiaceae bacterium]|nr:DUF1810 domain-containing protein [Casimicrobiaceae bacterium]MDW8312366.1 DUF1810 domain-containing protein [Burkholderiales bacterium]